MERAFCYAFYQLDTRGMEGLSPSCACWVDCQAVSTIPCRVRVESVHGPPGPLVGVGVQPDVGGEVGVPGRALPLPLAARPWPRRCPFPLCPLWPPRLWELRGPSEKSPQSSSSARGAQREGVSGSALMRTLSVRRGTGSGCWSSLLREAGSPFQSGAAGGLVPGHVLPSDWLPPCV